MVSQSSEKIKLFAVPRTRFEARKGARRKHSVRTWYLRMMYLRNECLFTFHVENDIFFCIHHGLRRFAEAYWFLVGRKWKTMMSPWAPVSETSDLGLYLFPAIRLPLRGHLLSITHWRWFSTWCWIIYFIAFPFFTPSFIYLPPR